MYGSTGGRAALIAAFMTGGLATAAAQEGAPDCEAMRDLDLAGYEDLEIGNVTHVDEGSAHCLVEGSFEHRVGADGKDYAIGFAIALPDDWSGRYMLQGGGGLNGVVRPPLGPTATGDQTALARGFAVISHDSGHEGAVFDPSFKQDQLAGLNFAQASVRKVAELGSAIVARYYGEAAEHSYFAGCSTGGREGMTAAARFPRLFDGIIVGAPAMRTNRSNMALASKAVAMNRISPEGADGAPDRSAAFSTADRELIMRGLLDACDSLDGVEDGMIFNRAQCSFDPSTLVCDGDKTESCLSAEQADVVEATFSPTLDAAGHATYPAFPYDTGIMDTEGSIPGIMRLDDERNFQYRNHATEFDVDDARERVDSDPQQLLVNTDIWTDLSTFADQGSKILFFHGESDPWFSANDTVGYVERMRAATGERVGDVDWSALYMVPGMAHCRGGSAGLDHFDLLTALVDWVEEGESPGAVTATGEAFPSRSRPLCPYPQYAHYSGDGDPEDAASFECRE